MLSASVVPVLEWLLTYAVHSTLLLGGAALVALRFSEEHWWLARLWKTAMLGAIVTTSVQMGIEREPLGGRWRLIVSEELSTSGLTQSSVPDRGVASPQPASAFSASPSSGEPAAGEPVRAAARPARATPLARSSILDTRGPSQWLRSRWPNLVVALWLSVAGVGLARFVIAYRRVRRVLFAGAREGSEATDGRAIELGDRSFRLAVSSTCDVPVALPGRAIVLPERFATELQPDEQRVALAHEIAHLVRRDPEWLSLSVILERLFFFQPLNRLARRELSASAEFLCDEWAVRQTGTPLALARCLASVATWGSSNAEAAVGAVAIARRDSPLVRRVQRILAEPRLAPRHPSSMWLVAAVIVVAAVAPMFSAQVPSFVEYAAKADAMERSSNTQTDKRPVQQPPTADEIAKAREQLRVMRPENPAAPLEERWGWALAEANRRGLRDFWLVYSFSTPTHAEHMMMSDSLEGSFVIHEGKVFSKGPALADVLDGVSPGGAAGPVVVTLKYSSGRGDDAISRGAYRSASLGFDFGRRPVFWLGPATEADSFRRLEQLTSRVRDEKLRILFIEAASVHPTTDLVLPFLVRLLDPSNPVAIRREAAEGFDHHHDPRSVEILLRTARQDPAEEVRAEAAETIGEVQTPESIPALKELVLNSPDGNVRREAAEAFSDQPADRALPALGSVIASSTDDGTLGEAVEALGDIGGQRASEMLVDVAWKHANEQARREAVETLASIEGDVSLAALVRIAWEHPDTAMQTEAVESIGDKAGSSAEKELERIIRDHPRDEVQAEAVETIADVSEGLNETVVQTARSGKNARVRREAIDALSHAAGQISDIASLDRIEQVLEAAIFEDPDHSVRVEAMDALDELPAARARRVRRTVIERHPDSQIREEATDHDRERNR